MNQAELKYRIKHIVHESYPTREERAQVVREMAAAVGCHENHIRRIWNYQVSEVHEAKLQDLQAIAVVLNVTLPQLLHDSERDSLKKQLALLQGG